VRGREKNGRSKRKGRGKTKKKEGNERVPPIFFSFHNRGKRERGGGKGGRKRTGGGKKGKRVAPNPGLVLPGEGKRGRGLEEGRREKGKKKRKKKKGDIGLDPTSWPNGKGEKGKGKEVRKSEKNKRKKGRGF